MDNMLRKNVAVVANHNLSNYRLNVVIIELWLPYK